jgi:hypothetical protein
MKMRKLVAKCIGQEIVNCGQQECRKTLTGIQRSVCVGGGGGGRSNVCVRIPQCRVASTSVVEAEAYIDDCAYQTLPSGVDETADTPRANSKIEDETSWARKIARGAVGFHCRCVRDDSLRPSCTNSMLCARGGRSNKTASGACGPSLCGGPSTIERGRDAGKSMGDVGERV